MKYFLASAIAVAAFAAPAWSQGDVPVEYQNAAMVEQIGSVNEAIVNQRWLFETDARSLASVTQAGLHNSARVLQRNLMRDVADDFNNKARIYQRSRWSAATVRQTHDYAALSANRARIHQRTDDAVSKTSQRGDGNVSVIRQTAAAFSPVAKSRQNGINNFIDILQESFGGTVIVSQDSFLDADETDSADAVAPPLPNAIDNEATVVSRGLNPTVRVKQTGQLNFADVREGGIDGWITIRTDAFANLATVDQYSVTGVAAIEQIGGDVNNASIWQDSSDFASEALIEQSGIGGQSSIIQLDTDGLGGENSASSRQSGANWVSDLISSTILQDGTGNVAVVDQSSGVAVSTIEQLGSSHTANVSQ